MVDIARGSILNFDSGISRVIWDAPPQVGELPDRRQLPPAELAATQQLNRLLLADNIESALARSLQPAVASPSVLQPSRFADSLHAFRRQLDRAMSDAPPERREKLEAMGKVLEDQGDLKETFNFYVDMLIAG
jgi:hypothetical protein